LGPDNPPLPVYIFGFAALFSRNPLWLSVTNAVLNLLAVAGVLALGWRYFSPRIGLLAGALYAADAYAVIYARKPAGTFLEPVGAVLVLWALLSLSRRGRRSSPAEHAAQSAGWRWAGAFAALAVLVQLHLGAALAAPVVVGFWFVDVLRGRRGALMAGVAGLALGGALFAPYLAYELAHKIGFLALLGGAAGGSGGAWSLESVRLAWTLVSSPAYGDLMGSLAPLFNAESWPAFWLAALVGVAAAGGLALAIARGRERRCLLLALWVLVPLALTVHHTVGLQLHYFLFLEPALFLLAGLGADWLVARFRPAYAVVGALLAVQVLAFSHFTAFLRSHALPDSYGLPLTYEQQVLAAAPPLAHGGRVVVATSGRDQAEAAVYLLGGASNVETDASAGLLLPAEGGAYVTLTNNSPAGQVLAGQAPALGMPATVGAHGDASPPAPDPASQASAAGASSIQAAASSASAADASSLRAGASSAGTSSGAPTASATQPALTVQLPGGDSASVYTMPAASAAQRGTAVLRGLGQTAAAGISSPDPAPAWNDGLRLLGVGYPRSLPGQLAAAWQVTRPLPADTMLFSQLLDDGGKRWFDQDAVPAAPSTWRPGDVVVSLTQASLPAGAPRQEYIWWLGAYQDGGQRVPLDSGGLAFRAGRLKGGTPSPLSAGLTPAGEVFGGALRLDGYSLSSQGITLQWTCLAPLARDYTVFVHVLDSSGRVIAQHDSGPLDDRYPTSLWDPGEVVTDQVTLPIPNGSRLEVGLYEQPTGRRLTTSTGADHIDLTAP
jgi:hypothetical protein